MLEVAVSNVKMLEVIADKWRRIKNFENSFANTRPWPITMTEKSSLSQDVDDWLDKQSETLDFYQEELCHIFSSSPRGEDFLISTRPMRGDKVDDYIFFSVPIRDLFLSSKK